MMTARFLVRCRDGVDKIVDSIGDCTLVGDQEPMIGYIAAAELHRMPAGNVLSVEYLAPPGLAVSSTPPVSPTPPPSTQPAEPEPES